MAQEQRAHAGVKTVALLADDREQADLAFLAMQFALREERIATTLVGTSSADKMRRNIEALTAPLDDELLSEVWDILAPVKDQVWPSGNWRGAP